ncbi:hypothetical protein BHE74_00023259 [Ensete ventricosum]|nr:hypothetical protein GW17_00019900 [Ensete ventricosum]RWW69153.1 hypothetical protein BHE74_00023259 [Ensete ventricosum]
MFAVRGGAADSQTTAVVFFTVEEEEEEEEESGNDRTPTANRSGTRVGRGDVPIGRVWCWLFSAESSTCQCLIEGPTRAPHAPYHTLTDSCRRRTERPYVFAESRLKTSLALFGIASTRGSMYSYTASLRNESRHESSHGLAVKRDPPSPPTPLMTTNTLTHDPTATSGWKRELKLPFT